jgi:hypothetical protein
VKSAEDVSKHGSIPRFESTEEAGVSVTDRQSVRKELSELRTDDASSHVGALWGYAYGGHTQAQWQHMGHGDTGDSPSLTISSMILSRTPCFPTLLSVYLLEVETPASPTF